tara:strand:- start:843 stop:1064 length:222 start_codon:yes stop_codon:yes gene_type:complete
MLKLDDLKKFSAVLDTHTILNIRSICHLKKIMSKYMFFQGLQQLGLFEYFFISLKIIFQQLFNNLCVIEIKKI